MKLNEIIPTVEYDNGQYKFRNIFFKHYLKTEIEEKYLQIYRLSDGETLEDVAYNLYGNTEYFWTILIINNFTDPIFDIALSEDAIQEQARDLSMVDGVIEDSLYFQTYDQISRENDNKRNIKVIANNYLNTFITNLIREYEKEIENE